MKQSRKILREDLCDGLSKKTDLVITLDLEVTLHQSLVNDAACFGAIGPLSQITRRNITSSKRREATSSKRQGSKPANGKSYPGSLYTRIFLPFSRFSMSRLSCALFLFVAVSSPAIFSNCSSLNLLTNDGEKTLIGVSGPVTRW